MTAELRDLLTWGWRGGCPPLLSREARSPGGTGTRPGAARNAPLFVLWRAVHFGGGRPPGVRRSEMAARKGRGQARRCGGRGPPARRCGAPGDSGAVRRARPRPTTRAVPVRKGPGGTGSSCVWFAIGGATCVSAALICGGGECEGRGSRFGCRPFPSVEQGGWPCLPCKTAPTHRLHMPFGEAGSYCPGPGRGWLLLSSGCERERVLPSGTGDRVAFQGHAVALLDASRCGRSAPTSLAAAVRVGRGHAATATRG